MKNRAQRILADHPLIWNTRAHILLPLLVLIHLVAFVGGWMHSFTLSSVPFEYLSPPTGVTLFAMLTGLLVLIGWLVFYLRNNALKSLYPVSRGRMLAEYGIIFTVCLGSVAITETYSAGMRLSFAQAFRNVDIVQEANVVNQAKYFLVFDFNEFYQGSAQGGSERAPGDGRVYTDTIPQAETARFSFLNYAGQPISFYPDSEVLRSGAELRATAHRWLQEGRKDSVRQAINAYLKLVRRYGGSYQLNVDRWVNDLFRTPDFRVQRKLGNSEDPQGQRTEEYVQGYVAQSAIENIHRARHLDPFDDEVLFVLLAALELSLVVLSFRLINLRPWVMALIGSLVWMIVLSLLGFLFRESDAGLLFLFLALHLGVLGFAIRGIYAQRAKTAAGVTFVWALWSLPFALPLLAAGIASAVQSSYTHRYGYTGHTPPVSAWINTHMTLILYADALWVMVLTGLVLLPLARRWQAMAEG